ncbi:MAG: hypothetical protein IKA77_03305, partial [Clostridia bacterium]|nr:hypothetical protein [Clostridia bacterium]
TAPNGKQFKGWATSQNGEVISGTTNVTADLVLYAIWEDILSEEPENPNGGSGNAGGNEGGQGGSTPAPTPDTTPDTTPEDEAEAGLSGGAIAGIAVGATAGATLIGFAIFWFVIKKKSFADLLALLKKAPKA